MEYDYGSYWGWGDQAEAASFIRDAVSRLWDVFL